MQKALLPLAWLYGIGTGLRNKLFDWGILQSKVSQLWQWRRGRIAVEYSGGCGLDVLITKNKQAVMCHGLFIELIADIKKTNRKG